MGKTICAPAVRRRAEHPLPKDVREAKGGSFQSRPWIGPRAGANVNLGIFRVEVYGNDRDAAVAAASRAAIAFKKAMAHRGADIWDVIQQLQRTTRFGLPMVPLHVLPPRVQRRGSMFGIRDLPDLYPTVEAAWAIAKPIFFRPEPRGRSHAA